MKSFKRLSGQSGFIRRSAVILFISCRCLLRVVISIFDLPGLTNMAYESVAEAYNGKTVFITGATGFLGKVILEKLLYSCPGVKKVYLLIREKPSENANQRVQKILDQALFTRLREDNPKVIEKVAPIIGDISKPNLGMEASDEQLLKDSVSIVFHVAATIKFNEPLEKAMNINVGGTERVLSLCRQLKNPQCFVHISTAFSNTNREVVNEIVYPAGVSFNEVNKLIEIGINEDQIKNLLKGRPNTYTFTKALAENLVVENHGHVPAVIIRPSVVSSSEMEPLVGWIDNWFGATALMTSISKGLTRALLADPNNIIDLIPVDHVANLTIVAGAKCKSSEHVQVYNSSTSGENPLKLNQLLGIVIEDSIKHKFNEFPMPMLIFTKFKWMLLLITLLFQTLPAYLGDVILWLTGKKTRFVKIHNKALIVRDTLEYFASRTWNICAPNTKSLFKSLSESDKRTFPCDPTSIDWIYYIPTYCSGIRRFLCKLKC